MAFLRFSAATRCWLQVITLGAALVATPMALAQQTGATDEYQHDHKHGHEHGEDDFGSPGTHVHGQATLTIVVEGNEAMVALQSAAYNIVGFEHAPNNAEQRQEINAALDILRQGNWFSINPQAGCDVGEADANTDLTAKVSSKHSDFYANISLVCQQPARFNELTVSLFNLVPTLETISVQWVINGQQGATDLSLAKSSVSF
ncbi:ZrgA family zinc uptake protein [Arsukibacterium sp. UBA3155]|uniref:ZrgA family zinc uptake protein n=1 Tax=Arsukibacterium sp. UBA3155 TaxID=1946058 RepID=UPI0025C2451C|nr:DUF2796 domain-containing protein [Arsukibacterium sp. UBA3155]|tara:strand:+ start:80752 stop:81360 length:609 start_codon:yes stop_codon:yes gene_type:complete